MTYVALLRGTNVGGNNKVEMKKLKAACESAGLKNVKTYINSGNIIFTDTQHSPSKLSELIEKIINQEFDLDIKVVIRDLKNIQAVTKALPKHWVNDSTMKCDVMFLWSEFDSPRIKTQLNLKEGIDEIKYVPGALLWRVDRDKVTRSGILKLVGTPLYKGMTIRNCNTARKLLELMKSVKE